MARQKSKHRRRQQSANCNTGESEQERINRLYPAVPSEPARSAVLINAYFRKLAINNSCQPQVASVSKKKKKNRRGANGSTKQIVTPPTTIRVKKRPTRMHGSRNAVANAPATMEPDWWRERGE
jgi:hypothetical protein